MTSEPAGDRFAELARKEINEALGLEIEMLSVVDDEVTLVYQQSPLTEEKVREHVKMLGGFFTAFLQTIVTEASNTWHPMLITCRAIDPADEVVVTWVIDVEEIYEKLEASQDQYTIPVSTDQRL